MCAQSMWRIFLSLISIHRENTLFAAVFLVLYQYLHCLRTVETRMTFLSWKAKFCTFHGKKNLRNFRETFYKTVSLVIISFRNLHDHIIILIYSVYEDWMFLLDISCCKMIYIFWQEIPQDPDILFQDRPPAAPGPSRHMDQGETWGGNHKEKKFG